MISSVLMTEDQSINWLTYKTLNYNVISGVTHHGFANAFSLRGKVFAVEEEAAGIASKRRG